MLDKAVPAIDCHSHSTAIYRPDIMLRIELVPCNHHKGVLSKAVYELVPCNHHKGVLSKAVYVLTCCRCDQAAGGQPAASRLRHHAASGKVRSKGIRWHLGHLLAPASLADSSMLAAAVTCAGASANMMPSTAGTPTGPTRACPSWHQAALCLWPEACCAACSTCTRTAWCTEMSRSVADHDSLTYRARIGLLPT
jgi:hypothetical protein